MCKTIHIKGITLHGVCVSVHKEAVTSQVPFLFVCLRQNIHSVDQTKLALKCGNPPASAL